MNQFHMSFKKFQIIKVEDRLTVEVLEGNNVLFTKEFPSDMNLNDIREQLKKDVQVFEVKKKESESKENKKNEFKKLLNKKFPI